jgi:hypothetical protein
MRRGGRLHQTGPGDRFTPQAVDRMLGQLAERAAGDSDETLASAVLTGRSALAEWQDLADALRKLEGEYERLALSESRALARLQHVLDLLDKVRRAVTLGLRGDPSGRDGTK